MKLKNIDFNVGDVYSITLRKNNSLVNENAVLLSASESTFLFMPLRPNKESAPGRYTVEIAGLQNQTNSPLLYGMGNETSRIDAVSVSQFVNCKIGVLGHRDLATCMKSVSTYCLDTQAYVDWQKSGPEMLQAFSSKPSLRKHFLASALRMAQHFNDEDHKSFFKSVSATFKSMDFER